MHGQQSLLWSFLTNGVYLNAAGYPGGARQRGSGPDKLQPNHGQQRGQSAPAHCAGRGHAALQGAGARHCRLGRRRPAPGRRDAGAALRWPAAAQARTQNEGTSACPPFPPHSPSPENHVCGEVQHLTMLVHLQFATCRIGRRTSCSPHGGAVPSLAIK